MRISNMRLWTSEAPLEKIVGRDRKWQVGCSHTGKTPIGIDALARLLRKVVKLDPASLVGKAKLFKNYEDLGWIGCLVYNKFSF